MTTEKTIEKARIEVQEYVESQGFETFAHMNVGFSQTYIHPKEVTGIDPNPYNKWIIHFFIDKNFSSSGYGDTFEEAFAAFKEDLSLSRIAYICMQKAKEELASTIPNSE